MYLRTITPTPPARRTPLEPPDSKATQPFHIPEHWKHCSSNTPDHYSDTSSVLAIDGLIAEEEGVEEESKEEVDGDNAAPIPEEELEDSVVEEGSETVAEEDSEYKPDGGTYSLKRPHLRSSNRTFAKYLFQFLSLVRHELLLFTIRFKVLLIIWIVFSFTVSPNIKSIKLILAPSLCIHLQ